MFDLHRWSEEARRGLAEREFPVGALTELDHLIEHVCRERPGNVDELCTAIRIHAGMRLIVTGEASAVHLQRAAQSAYHAVGVLIPAERR